MYARLSRLISAGAAARHRLQRRVGFKPVFHLKRGQQLQTAYMVRGAKPGPTVTTWHLWDLANPMDVEEWEARSDEAALSHVAHRLHESGGSAYLLHVRTLKRIGKIDHDGTLHPLQQRTAKGLWKALVLVATAVGGLAAFASAVLAMFGTTVQQVIEKVFA